MPSECKEILISPGRDIVTLVSELANANGSDDRTSS